MPIPQRGIALASPCAHGRRIVRLEPGQLSGRLSCKSRAHHFAQYPLWALRTKHKGVSALLGRFFLSMRIGGDGSPFSPLQLIATYTCASLSHLFTLVGGVERRPFSTCWPPGRI